MGRGLFIKVFAAGLWNTIRGTFYEGAFLLTRPGVVITLSELHLSFTASTSQTGSDPFLRLLAHPTAPLRVTVALAVDI
ncbi:hypothetical protein AV903_25025 [Erwinia tracheiphila]|uniref:Uncharacterized protein n=1 Tax=Erwinia tracheiphila TaxID=65700 RepID=A0A345CYL0_9GAMM|nr:hypothetical protein AV903_25025 [Erwinia tracheiphila]